MHWMDGPWAAEVNSLVAGIFLLCSFGLLAASQAIGCIKIYRIQSIFLVLGAAIMAASTGNSNLWIVVAIGLITKVLLIPFLIRRIVRREMIARRELQQVRSVPVSLLIGLILCGVGYFVTAPLLAHTSTFIQDDLPIGFSAVLIAVYTITVRREALPQLLSLLAIENGAFFAGDAIAPNFPLIGELAACFDVAMIVLVLGVLSTQIHRVSGSTQVGSLSELKEI